jgi:hypothetical protein
MKFRVLTATVHDTPVCLVAIGWYSPPVVVEFQEAS